MTEIRTRHHARTTESDHADFQARLDMGRLGRQRIDVQQAPLVIDPDPAVRDGRARAIHEAERGADATFGALNLLTIPENLALAELFGVGRGCFGHACDRDGRIARAVGGSCLIDEITEASEDMVRRLTRYVTTGIIFKIGSERPERCDTRIILGAAERGPALDAIGNRLHARVV